MATVSIISNEGKLNSASVVLKVTATKRNSINWICISNKQVKAAARSRSESMTLIPTLSLSRLC